MDCGEVKHTKGSDNIWQKDKGVPNVRAPRMDPQASIARCTTEADRMFEAASASKLNANAKEFIPTMAQTHLPHQMSMESKIDDDIVYLKEALEILTGCPDRYEEFLPPITDIAQSLIHDNVGSSTVIDVILEQCIQEPNFRYTGARLCRALVNKFNLIYVECLLTKCGEKFHRMHAFINNARTRVCGFGLVMAELFLQVTIGEGQDHIRALALGVQSMILMLLANVASDTIKSVCQMLKLCGPALEKEGLLVSLIYEKLQEISSTYELDKNVQFMVTNLIRQRDEHDLHGNHGERQDYLPQVNEEVTDPVLYGPDGNVISEEENMFLRDNIPVSEDLDDYILDEEYDEEMGARYEDFLNDTPIRNEDFFNNIPNRNEDFNY